MSIEIFGRVQRKLLILCILLAVWTVGCGKEAKQAEAESQETDRKREYDLSMEEWRDYSEAVDQSEVWSVADYWDDSKMQPPESAEGMEGMEICHAFGGQEYYILEGFYGEADDNGRIAQKYYLTRLDLVSFEAERRELAFEAAQGAADAASGIGELAEIAKDSRFSVTCMDVIDGQICLLAAVYEEGEVTRICAIDLDEGWKAVRLMDLTSGLSQAGMFHNDMLIQYIQLDRDGQIYLITEDGIALFDGSGAFLACVEPPSGTVASTYSLPDGRPVFECTGSGTTGLIIFCVEGLDKKILYQSSYSYVDTRYANQYGELLYMSSGELRRWNAAEGSCEILYKDAGLKSMRCRAIFEASEGDIILALDDGDGVILLKLRLSGENRERIVTVYQLFIDDEIAKRAEEYSRKHPGIRIKVTSRNQDEDIMLAFNQLMAKLSMGKGPDLLVVQRKQLEALEDNGVLADLSDLLSDELKEQIFSGVLRYGMIEEKLYGIACSAGVATLAVSEEIWGKESWTYQDVMDLMNKAEKDGRQRSMFAHHGFPSTSDQLMYDLVLKDLPTGNSPFVDLEQKKCYFDTEEFKDVLEFCKTYGQKSDGGAYCSVEERVEAVRNGEALALGITGNLATFSQYMAMLGEGFQCVGYPTGGENGTFLAFYSCIGVNEASSNKDIALDFLQYLLSKEVQRQTGTLTVRRDVLTEYVEDGEPGGKEPCFVLRDSMRIFLAGKADGTSFLAEYMELMEKGMPESVWLDDMQMIITEEAAMYFAGDRSAEEAASVIQSRGQLYLSE